MSNYEGDARMGEQYRTPKVLVWATIALGYAGIVGCGSRPNVQTAETTPPPPPVLSHPPAPTERLYPWPYCDNSPEHRPPAVGDTPEGPIVLIDSNCTDPSDPYTGVYDPSKDASQETGVGLGRLRNGSRVILLCKQPGGQKIQNDKGIGTTQWDKVKALPGQSLLLPNSTETLTQGKETFLVPNTHLSFFDDSKVKIC